MCDQHLVSCGCRWDPGLNASTSFAHWVIPRSVCLTTCAMSLWSSGWYGRNDFVWQWQCWCVWPNIAIVGLYGLTLQSGIPRQDLNWATTTYTNHYPSCTSKFLWCSSPVILQQVYNCFDFFAFWFVKFILYLQLLRISCNFLGSFILCVAINRITSFDLLNLWRHLCHSHICSIFISCPHHHHHCTAQCVDWAVQFPPGFMRLDISKKISKYIP